MARQLRAEQTRAAIIAAAADLFDRQGYESTSLSDIVEHAQVTKGALYFHFAAKQELAHAILELQSRTLRRMAADMDSRGLSHLEALIRTTFGIARLSSKVPSPGPGSGWPPADSTYRRRSPTLSKNGWTSPPANSSARSRTPTSTRTSMSKPQLTPWSAPSSAPGSSAAPWNPSPGSRAGWPRCGTS